MTAGGFFISNLNEFPRYILITVAFASICIAAAAMIYGLFSVPMGFDELVMYDWYSRYSFKELAWRLVSHDVQPPTSYFIQKLLLMISSDLSVLRLPSFISTLLALLVYINHLKHIFNFRYVLVGAALFIASVIIVEHSFSIRPYAYTLLLSVLIMRVLSSGIPESKKMTKLIFYGVIALSLHYMSVFLLISGIGAIVFKHSVKGFQMTLRWPALLVGASTLLLVLVFSFKHLLHSFEIFSLASVQSLINNLHYFGGGTVFILILLVLFFASVSRDEFKKMLISENNIIYMFFGITLFSFAKIIFPDIFEARHLIGFFPVYYYLVLLLVRKSRFSENAKNLFMVMFVLSSIAHHVNRVYLARFAGDLESKQATAYAIDLAEKDEIGVVSCGNCPSYYYDMISSEQALKCVGISPPRDYGHGKNDYVYIVFNYNWSHCMREDLERLELLKQFEGITVFKILGESV